MKLGIKRRILAIAVITIFLALIIITISILSVLRLKDAVSSIYEHPFTVSRNILLSDIKILEIKNQIHDIVNRKDAENLAAVISVIEKDKKTALDHIAIVKTQILGDEGKKLIAAYEELYKSDMSLIDEILQKVRSGRFDEADKKLRNEEPLIFNNLNNNLLAILDYSNNKADGFRVQGSKAADYSITTSIILAAVSVIIIFMISYILALSLSKPITSITQSLNSTTTEILASVQQQSANTKEQAVSIQETTTTMDEISQTGRQVSDRAKQLVASTQNTNLSVENGTAAVEEANLTMEAIKEQVELVAENIVNLSEKNLAISEIIGSVTDIAEQTNLLALNASIEAVSAGEYGLRFSVVANELKSLSDQARESTRQIRGILEEIQKGINSSVMLTEEAVKRVESGKEKGDIARQTIKNLATATQESIMAFQQIVGATNQQQIGLEQVSTALNNINTATEQTAAGIGQIEKAIANLNLLSKKLNQIVHEV